MKNNFNVLETTKNEGEDMSKDVMLGLDLTTLEEKRIVDRIDTLIEIKILEIAKHKILDGWTQGCFARNRGGESVYPLLSTAYSFSLDGALKYAEHVVFNEDYRLKKENYNYIESVFNTLLYICGEVSLADFNDNLDRKRSEVVNLINKAIVEYGEINKK